MFTENGSPTNTDLTVVEGIMSYLYNLHASVFNEKDQFPTFANNYTSAVATIVTNKVHSLVDRFTMDLQVAMYSKAMYN